MISKQLPLIGPQITR